MALVEIIPKLNDVDLPDKLGHYLNITKLLLENNESAYDGLTNGCVKDLCCNILDDLKKSTNELPQLVKLLQVVFQNKYLQDFCPVTEKQHIINDIISIIDSSQHENVLVNCFSALIQVPFTSKLENSVINGLLECMADILTKKNEPAATYSLCSYFQKFLKEYEEMLSNFVPVLSKLVFLPLCHPSNKVREVAEKNLDMFPKILLYTSDEQVTTFLLKLVKETYSKDMLLLFKEKQELYVLKVWKHVVNSLGTALPANLSTIASFFQVIEKGFKSSVDEICIASFISWKSLIDNFAASDGVLNDSKKLRFILKPFKNISRSSENILSVACDAWMHLAWNLAGHLSSRFTEVCIPLLELTVGKIPNGLSEKTFLKGGPLSLIKKSCYILLRFLEQPPNESFNRLSSPKKLPHIPYLALQNSLDVKIITHHFKEILHTVKIIIQTCGTHEDMKPSLDCLMKSVLFIVSTIIEDSNKESIEAVTCYLNFLTDIIETKAYSSLACLKCLESLSKLPRKILVSHCFNCGPRKTQDILSTNLLKLLLNPHLFPSEAPKRFFATYNRLVQAGIHESFHPLSNAHKFLHIIRSAIGANSFEVEILIELWSGIATLLLEVIEKTQEVNQGDKQEHDFSCMYDVLTFPVEFIFPVYVHQFRTRPAFKLWTSLYKAFIRSASLVVTTTANEACEKFCSKLKSYLKEDLLKKPHFFESFCLLMQSVMESIEFASGSTSGIQGIADVALMNKRKKPLGNLTSFVDLLVILLKAYQTCYIEAEEDSTQSSAPTVQRKLHIVKNAAPLDILKAFFGNIKSGSIISYALEQFVDPISKLFVKSSQKRNLINHVDAKLEIVWSVISSSIERYYLGPYDSEFLTIMSPILEATFSHPRRNLKEKSRRFWFATFAPNTSSLKFPDSLKNVLKTMKLPLLPDDISQTEFSISPLQDSITEGNIDANPVTVSKQTFKSPISVNGEVSKVVTKSSKPATKISIDDLPSEEFVKIDSPIIATPQRRTVRKRKSYVPTLYNDLSQDTATMISSSQSQDTTDSAALELNETKASVTEVKSTFDKELTNIPSTSQNNVPSESKDVTNSPLSSKFEEKLDSNSKNEIVLLHLTESDDKAESQVAKKLKLDSSACDIENANKNDLESDKMSVFSKPGEKQLAYRKTRKTSKLSQTFSAPVAKKESEKLEYQMLSKSCVELIDLSDSEDIIPSSQSGSSENNIKITISTTEYKKTQLADNSICDAIINQASPIDSLQENEITGIDCVENFQTEMLKNKIITSTPSKIKMPTVIDGVKECETLIKNHEEISHNILTLPENNIVNNDKSNVSSDFIKTDKDLQNIVPKLPDENVCSEMQYNPDETTKNMNFPCDTVEDSVKIDTDPIPVHKNTYEPLSDVEMKDISESKTKASVINLPLIQNEKNEPEDKDDCVNSKLSDKNSKNESYCKKLRKKSAKSLTKSKPKVTKKKIPKKITTLNENAKNSESKNDIEKPKIVDLDQISDHEKSKIHSKDDQVHANLEKSKIDIIETTCFDKNNVSILTNMQKIENSVELVDKIKINVGNVENAESCEIFEAFSESCKDTEDNDIADIASVDAKDSDGTSEINENVNDLISQANLTCESHFQTPDVDDNVTIIPPSLEAPNQLTCKTVIEKNVKDAEILIAESSIIEPSPEIASNNANILNEMTSEPLSIQFSITDDDLSCEMHDIVKSVINECTERILNEDLSENKLDTSNQCKIEENASFAVVNEKFNLPVAKPSEITGNSSNNDSVTIYTDNSSNVIISNKIEESSTVLDNSIAMDVELNVKNENLKEEENFTQLKMVEHTEESVSEKPVSNFSPELDHSYSLSDQFYDVTCINKNFTENDKKEDIGKCNDSESEDSDDIIIDVVRVSPERESNLVVKNSEQPLNLVSSSLWESELLVKDSSISSENEVKSILRDLIIKVENLSFIYTSTNKCDILNTTNDYTNVENPNSNKVADKENQMFDITDAKGSRKRKIKPPIRSPFNFRHRSRSENSKKHLKSLKSVNLSQIKSITVNNDLVIRPVYPPDEQKHPENIENSMAKIISSIVDSVTSDDTVDKETHPNVTTLNHSAKAAKVELSNDELTDLNTRLNASIAPQTRRSKMIAASHKVPETENEPLHSNVIVVCSENSPKNLSSILKKRKSSSSSLPAKARKVTFAHPLISEVLIESITERNGSKTVTEAVQTVNKSYKVFQRKKKSVSPVPVLPVGPIESEDVPSSSEYQDSDVLDFNDLPVSPALINCPDSISNILKDLTSPSWIRGLESLLNSKNIKSIGDVCKLNIHQVKALPFKSPKVLTLHKALMGYINRTQEATLQKFKTIDDGSFVEMDASSSSSIDSNAVRNEEGSSEESPKTLEEAVMDVLKKERLKELPLSVLGQLVEACGKAIVEKK